MLHKHRVLIAAVVAGFVMLNKVSTWKLTRTKCCMGSCRRSGSLGVLHAGRAVLNNGRSHALPRLGICTVDIIDFDYEAWHTTDDAGSASLERVGRVLERFLEAGGANPVKRLD